MAKKPDITTIASGYYSRQALNSNFENLQTGFDNTLSLDGSTPNAMGADLDMNSNDILNADVVNASALRLDGVLVSSSSLAASGASLFSTDHTGDGTTVAYSTTYQAFIKDNTQVYIDGVYQNKAGYSISGTTLTFSEAPPLNAAIEIVVARSLNVGGTTAANVEYSLEGSPTTSTNVAAFLDGVGAHYDTTAELFNAPAEDNLTVKTHGHTVKGDGSGGTYVYDSAINRKYADGFHIVDTTIRSFDQGFGTGTGCFVLQQDHENHFQVGEDKVLLDPDKQRYHLRGAFLFDYLFVTSEARTNYEIRQNSYGWPSIGIGTSPQTGYARIQWRNLDYVKTMLDRASQDGINTIKIGVDPAMVNTSAQTIADGNEYPSDIHMLGAIVHEATKRKMVVLLRQGRKKNGTATEYGNFMAHLINIYKDNPYVWYNPENEINAGITDDVPTWVADMETFFSLMNTAGRVSPVVINTTQYSGHDGIDACYSAMKASSSINFQKNLIVGMHIYQGASELDGFLGTSRQDNVDTAIQKLHNSFCLFIEEFGINNNLTGGEDPDINYGGTTGAYSALWDTGAQVEWSKEILRYFLREVRAGRLIGVMGITYSAYIPGTGNYPTNIIRKYGNDADGNTGSITNWGSIFTDFLTKDWDLQPKMTGNRLEYNSGVYLYPYAGASVVIGDYEYLVPEQGINLSSTGVTQDALRYVYVYKDTDGMLKLEASSSAPVRDPANGNFVKAVTTSVTGGSGNTFAAPGRTLVGMVYKTAAGFKSDADQRLVRSWWNRKGQFSVGSMASNDAHVGSISDIVGLKAEVLLWANEFILTTAGVKYDVSGGVTNVTFRIQSNGTTVNPEQILTTPASENHFATVTVPVGSASTAAYYDIRGNGGSSGNTVTFKSGGQIYGMIQGDMS